MSDKADTPEKPEKDATAAKPAAQPTTLENANDGFFSAIMSGDSARAREAALTDGVVSDSEAALLVRARLEGERIHYAEEVAERAAARPAPVAEQGVPVFFVPEEAGDTEGVTPSGTLIGLSGGVYKDGFGGAYDKYGYLFADGSYQTVGGEYYDAKANTLALQDGTVFQLDDLFDGCGQHFLCTTMHVAEIVDTLKNEEKAAAAPAAEAPTSAAPISSFQAPTPEEPKDQAPDVEASEPALADLTRISRKLGGFAVPVALVAKASFIAAAAAGPAAALAQMEKRRALTRTEVCVLRQCMLDHAAEGHDIKKIAPEQFGAFARKVYKAMQDYGPDGHPDVERLCQLRDSDHRRHRHDHGHDHAGHAHSRPPGPRLA